MTVIWCMVPEIWIATNRIFCHFVPFFPLLPPNKPKNQNFEKLKETPRYIIILHMYTVNDNHMMYSSWDMERHGQNFLSFWTIFCPFTSLKTWKIKVLKKWKKSLEVLSFYTSVPTIMIICYTVPEMWCVTDVIIFSFWANFCPFTPNLPKKWKLKKKKRKNHREISFYSSIPKIMIIWYTVPEIWCVTDVIIFHFELFFALLPP